MKTPADTRLPNRTPKKKPTAPLGAAPASKAPEIELWQRESCPFSHAVRHRLSELGLDFVAHNVNGSDLKHQQLVQAGGKDQIPFLQDHRTGVKLYDSSAIVSYLDKEYGSGAPSSRILRVANRFTRRIENRREQAAWVFQSARDARETLFGTARWVASQMRKGRQESGSEDTRPPEPLTRHVES